MALRAGRLRHRVDIQRRQQAREQASGAVEEVWVTVWPKVPAAVEPLSVREYLAADARQSQITCRITIRAREGLTADMRILHKGRVYNPAGWLADADSGLEYLTAPCSEGVNQG